MVDGSGRGAFVRQHAAATNGKRSGVSIFTENSISERTADDAAMKANRFWWYRQNNAMNQACQKTADCWLPRNHNGDCQPYLLIGRIMWARMPRENMSR